MGYSHMQSKDLLDCFICFWHTSYAVQQNVKNVIVSSQWYANRGFPGFFILWYRRFDPKNNVSGLIYETAVEIIWKRHIKTVEIMVQEGCFSDNISKVITAEKNRKITRNIFRAGHRKRPTFMSLPGKYFLWTKSPTVRSRRTPL